MVSQHRKIGINYLKYEVFPIYKRYILYYALHFITILLKYSLVNIYQVVFQRLKLKMQGVFKALYSFNQLFQLYFGANCTQLRQYMYFFYKKCSKTDRVSIGLNIGINIPIETLSVLEGFLAKQLYLGCYMYSLRQNISILWILRRYFGSEAELKLWIASEPSKAFNF